MLKKTNRISKKKDFEEVKEKGKIYQSRFFGLVTLKKEDKEKKFGFIISKKISKRAVDRNKIKRLLAESVRFNLDRIGGGLRGIFLVKREILGKKMPEVKEEVIKTLDALK